MGSNSRCTRRRFLLTSATTLGAAALAHSESHRTAYSELSAEWALAERAMRANKIGELRYAHLEFGADAADRLPDTLAFLHAFQRWTLPNRISIIGQFAGVPRFVATIELTADIRLSLRVGASGPRQNALRGFEGRSIEFSAVGATLTTESGTERWAAPWKTKHAVQIDEESRAWSRLVLAALEESGRRVRAMTFDANRNLVPAAARV